MKANELRDLSAAELNTRKKDETDALQKLRFNRAVAGQVENPAKYRQHKREIARLNTVLREKTGQ
jgi:large subunit ribosomal protein L29